MTQKFKLLNAELSLIIKHRGAMNVHGSKSITCELVAVTGVRGCFMLSYCR